MKKLITSLLLVAVAFAASMSFADNLLASGEITIAATTTPSTNTQNVGVYDVLAKKEWSQVKAIIVQNNSDFVTTTTVARVDLDDTTTLLTAVAASNATTYASYTAYGVATNALVVYSGTNDANIVSTNFTYTYFPVAAPCAKDLTITVTTPTNDASATLEYLIYGE